MRRRKKLSILTVSEHFCLHLIDLFPVLSPRILNIEETIFFPDQTDTAEAIARVATETAVFHVLASVKMHAEFTLLVPAGPYLCHFITPFILRPSQEIITVVRTIHSVRIRDIAACRHEQRIIYVLGARHKIAARNIGRSANLKRPARCSFLHLRKFLAKLFQSIKVAKINILHLSFILPFSKELIAEIVLFIAKAGRHEAMP